MLIEQPLFSRIASVGLQPQRPSEFQLQKEDFPALGSAIIKSTYFKYFYYDLDISQLT